MRGFGVPDVRRKIKLSIMKTSKIIVAFHIGRGGRHNNPGHLTFIGEKNFQELLSLNCNNVFEHNQDEKGGFCTPFLTDGQGNSVTDDDIRGEVGRLEFDGHYDTYTARYIEDCTDSELEVIVQSNLYKRGELAEWLVNHNPEWLFDQCGFLLESEK